MSIRPPNGTYPATACSGFSRFEVDGCKYQIECDIQVKGNVSDTVMVTDNSIVSQTLGLARIIGIYEDLITPQIPSIKIPPSLTLHPRVGVYAAVCGGYVSRFSDGTHEFEIQCKNGIRTIRASDTVTVADDKITSERLGEAIDCKALVKL